MPNLPKNEKKKGAKNKGTTKGRKGRRKGLSG
jgi:hypothetical protein